MVLLLRQHAIEPDHAWAGVRDGRIPYAQSVPAPAQILSHETEEGETRTAIDAGDGRGQSAFELADEEAFPPALRLLSQRLRATRSRASTLRSELSLVPCAQPGRGKPLVHVRSGLSLAGSADKALALEARRCPPVCWHNEQPLVSVYFREFQFVETTTLQHALWSATGVLITD